LWTVASQQRLPLQVEAQVSYSGEGLYAFDPTGQLFAVYDDQAIAVKVWDVAARNLHRTVPMLPYQPVSSKPTMEVKGVTFSRDGSHIVAVVNGRMRDINIEAGKVQLSLPRSNHQHQGIAGGNTTSVDFNHDGTLLATAGTDATVNFWDGESGEYAGMLEGFGGAVTSVRFHPCQNQVVTRDAAGNLTLWGLDIHIQHPTDKVQPSVIWNRLISSPDSSASQPVAPSGAVRSAQLAVSRGTPAKIAVPMQSGEVRIVDWATGDVLLSIPGSGQITGLAFHHGQSLLAVAYASKLVRLVGPEDGAPVREWEVPEFPLNGVAFSNDGKHVVTIGHDVAFWSLTTGQKDLQKQLPSNALNAAAVNPATGAIAVTAGDQTLTLWNPYTIKDHLEALGLRWD
jgi:WD40 repeat protein